jgi:hypothetical protein
VGKPVRLGQRRELGNLRRRPAPVQNQPDPHRLTIRPKPGPFAKPFSAGAGVALLYNGLRS